MSEQEKYIYTIGEVAKMVRENVSTIRFWCDTFPQLNPETNKKGNRLFKQEDLNILKSIVYLLRYKKMTIEGAMILLKKNKNLVEKNAEIHSRLLKIRNIIEHSIEEIQSSENSSPLE